MFKIIAAIWLAIWPPARRHARAIEAAQRQAKTVEDAQKRTKMVFEEEKKRIIAEQPLRSYQAHVKTVDLNGIASLNGKPMNPSAISDEVIKRLSLATCAKRNHEINLANKMSDEEIAATTGKLDQTALKWLLQHKDPENQRKAATAIIKARADFDEIMPLDLYVTVVAEAVARSASKMRPSRIIAAVTVRAILLRSTDTRWTKTRQSELRPLSQPHW
jgi:hypothetical protein